ncbi:MAG: hypothetical protein ACOCRX_08675 [Candidatus Woesearchaeota archaeon]
MKLNKIDTPVISIKLERNLKESAYKDTLVILSRDKRNFYRVEIETLLDILEDIKRGNIK